MLLPESSTFEHPNCSLSETTNWHQGWFTRQKVRSPGISNSKGDKKVLQQPVNTIPGTETPTPELTLESPEQPGTTPQSQPKSKVQNHLEPSRNPQRNPHRNQHTKTSGTTPPRRNVRNQTGTRTGISRTATSTSGTRNLTGTSTTSRNLPEPPKTSPEPAPETALNVYPA